MLHLSIHNSINLLPKYAAIDFISIKFRHVAKNDGGVVCSSGAHQVCAGSVMPGTSESDLDFKPHAVATPSKAITAPERSNVESVPARSKLIP